METEKTPGDIAHGEKFSDVEIKTNKHNFDFRLYIGNREEGEALMSHVIANHYKEDKERAAYWIRQLKGGLQYPKSLDYGILLYDNPLSVETLREPAWRIESSFKKTGRWLFILIETKMSHILQSHLVSTGEVNLYKRKRKLSSV